MSTAADRLLIIGFGHPLRGDDGLGWRAAEQLAAAGRPALACQELTPELAEPISQAGRVVFIDAAAEGEPGHLQITDLTPGPADPGAFSHQLTPAGLLALAGAWYGRTPPATLITAAGADFGYSETLSPPVTAALARILRLVAAL